MAVRVAESAVKCLTLHSLAIPMRRKVAHAASTRDVAEPIVVAIELIGGAVGYGETLPRPYVTGEDNGSALAAIGDELAPRLLELHPERFAHALEAIDALPWRTRAGAPMPAARAAVELALLDVYSRHFRRPIHDVAGWLGMAGFGAPGSSPRVRYSGVLTSEKLTSTRRTLRMLWWYGLRHFKLKVADAGECERLELVLRYLRRGIDRGRATLRLDANGGWTPDAALERLGDWREMPIAGIEQPLPKGREDQLKLLADVSHAPLFHDESLVTLDDARRLIELGVAGGFNIRLSKCGGLIPSLKVAELARHHGVAIQLGCMVGETSILSAAGRRFIEMVPGVNFAEGWFGSFLLSDDVIARPLRFGFGGRGRDLPGLGWGIDVEPEALQKLASQPATRFEL